MDIVTGMGDPWMHVRTETHAAQHGNHIRYGVTEQLLSELLACSKHRPQKKELDI